MATHSSVLAWRIPGTGSLVGCRLWGRTELDTTKATQQKQQFLIWTSLVAQMVRNLPAMQEIQVQSLVWEGLLEKGVATYSSILAWRIPGTGSLVGCRLWGHTESDTTEATQQQQQELLYRRFEPAP